MAIKLEDLDLSVRTCVCLTRAGYDTLEDVASKTRDEIKRVRNLGRRSFAELEDIMHGNGLYFADEKEPEKQMFSHEQLSAPKGFIVVHAENDDVYYVNVDSIAGFSAIVYDDDHRATVITLVYKLTTGMRDYIIVTETPQEICTLINHTRR